MKYLLNITLIIFLFSSCTSIRNKEIPEVGHWGASSPKQHKVNLLVEVTQELNGKIQIAADKSFKPEVNKHIEEESFRLMKDSGYFSHVYNAKETVGEKGKATIEFRIKRKEKTTNRLFIGLTLGLWPLNDFIEFELEAKLLSAGRLIKHLELKDGTTKYIQVLLAPFYFLSKPQDVEWSVLSNMMKTFIQKLEQDRIL